jgi:hypothetical protein
MEGNPFVFATVLRTGFYHLVLDQSNTMKPETFNMDWDRLSGFYRELVCATTITSMLAGLFAESTRLFRAGASAYSDRIQHVSHCATEVGKLVKYVGENVKDCTPSDVIEVFFNIINNILFFLVEILI